MLKHPQKRFGDRPDGYRIRNLSTTAIGAIGYMRSRVEAQVVTSFDADLTKTEQFIREHKKDMPGLSLQLIIYAALIRAYAKFPRGGRFIVGKKLYGRDDLRINIMVKPMFAEDEEEVCVPVTFDRSETLPVVVEKYNKALANCLNENESKKKAKAEGFKKNPKHWFSDRVDLICARMSGLAMFLDKHNLLPASLINMSPFHGTIFVTNVGSIGLQNLSHHLYNFGTISLFTAISAKKRKLVRTESGIQEKRFIRISYTADERICEGYYWSCIHRYSKRMIENPMLLMTPPDKVRMDK